MFELDGSEKVAEQMEERGLHRLNVKRMEAGGKATMKQSDTDGDESDREEGRDDSSGKIKQNVQKILNKNNKRI